MIAFGLLLAAVGFDTLTGAPRLTFGHIEMLSGIGFVPVTIGLFGIGEIIASAEESGIGFVERISAKVGFKDLLEALAAMRQRLWLVDLQLDHRVLVRCVAGSWRNGGVVPGLWSCAPIFKGESELRQRRSVRASWVRSAPPTPRGSARWCR